MRKRKRKGLSLVETVVSLVLITLAIIVMAKVTAAKVTETASIDSQYSLINADAMLSDMYRDFHSCYNIIIDYNESTGHCSVSFDLGAEGLSFYEYVPDTGYFYKNGAQQFRCTKFFVQGNLSNLLLSLKLANEKVLEIDIYR